VIHDVDESLRTLVERDVAPGAAVEISFEAPNRDWAARRNTPTLNLYLYDIKEDLDRRQVQVDEIRDERGIVTDRVPPPRRFKLSYLVTAWTQRPEDEHRLLSSVLSCFLRFDALPADVLQGSLSDQPHPVRLTIGLPLPPERSLNDVWSALGGDLKASLDLILTTPIVTGRHRFVGPPVLEEPRIGVSGPTIEREQAAGKPAGGKRRTAPAGAPVAAVPRERVVTTESVGPPVGKPGRRLTITTQPQPTP
jgi:uncharacterized protein DUF4255